MAAGDAIQLYHVPLALDASGRRFAPAAVLIQERSVVRVDSPQSIGEVRGVKATQLLDRVVTPGFVNVHAHLDLTHIGPMPYPGSFTKWVGRIRLARAKDERAIAASVKRGIELSRAGGTAIIGDIAGVGSLTPITTLRESGMAGVSYLEVFGQGPRGEVMAEGVMRTAIAGCAPVDRGVRLGLQPHAPYSCSPRVYRTAAALGRAHDLPLATHLAETQEELLFVRSAAGPLAEMLQAIGVWDDSIAAAFDRSSHPIEALAPILAETPFVAAHLNYIDEAHIEQLAGWPITIAYCPRASAYFGHPQADQSSEPPNVQWPEGEALARMDAPTHRYRDMIEAGIHVALGTDSIVCLDTADRLSVLDEMRLLYRRDDADPMTLLQMATINGAKAMGLDPSTISLRAGAAGLLGLRFDPDSAADPFVGALIRDDAPEWIAGPLAPVGT